MLKINNNQIDLILQLEEHTNIQKVFDMLTLNIDEILIICPEVFFQRFIQALHEEFSECVTEGLDRALAENKNYIELQIPYKKKDFNFHFIITSSELQAINNPFKGTEIYKMGFTQIQID